MQRYKALTCTCGLGLCIATQSLCRASPGELVCPRVDCSTPSGAVKNLGYCDTTSCKDFWPPGAVDSQSPTLATCNTVCSAAYIGESKTLLAACQDRCRCRGSHQDDTHLYSVTRGPNPMGSLPATRQLWRGPRQLPVLQVLHRLPGQRRMWPGHAGEVSSLIVLLARVASLISTHL